MADTFTPDELRHKMYVAQRAAAARDAKRLEDCAVKMREQMISATERGKRSTSFDYHWLMDTCDYPWSHPTHHETAIKSMAKRAAPNFSIECHEHKEKSSGFMNRGTEVTGAECTLQWDWPMCDDD